MNRMSTGRGFVHEARLELEPGADPRAPGGAVTVALCGHWEHDGPCRWPHNSAIDSTALPARFRTVFVCRDESAAEVRNRIESALRSAKGWTVISSGPRELTESEQALASRLGETDPEPRT